MTVEANTFLPVGDRLLLKRVEEKIKGGIIIPEVHEGKRITYEVLAVSEKEEDIKVGDKVVAVPDGAQKIFMNGHGTCEIIEKRRIFGVIEDE